jgi:hypothetical protein
MFKLCLKQKFFRSLGRLRLIRLQIHVELKRVPALKISLYEMFKTSLILLTPKDL